MSNRVRPSEVGEHERAVHRLQAAEAEQSRLRGERPGGRGAPEDSQAEASLQTADDQVVARKRWLKSVEDHHEDVNG